MSGSAASLTMSRRSLACLLIVGVLIGLTLASGADVFASGNSKTVTVCANELNFLRYAKNGKCLPGDRKLVLNQQGEVGDKGDTGAVGA